MVTQAELDAWIVKQGLKVIRIENGCKFGSSNPWDAPENDEEHGTVRLIDGIIHIDWIEDGWNGYGEETFTSIKKFAKRFTSVMMHGLQG